MTRAEIEDRATTLLQDKPDYQLLATIPVIGPINALTILAEAGDLRRFGHPVAIISPGRRSTMTAPTDPILPLDRPNH